jgi:hypothetical protein
VIERAQDQTGLSIPEVDPKYSIIYKKDVEESIVSYLEIAGR